VQLATATATLTANADELRLALLEPVADVKKLTSGSVDLRLSGDLARWKTRAEAVAPIPAYQIGGSIVASGHAKIAPDRITVDRLTVALTNAKFLGAGIVLDEPNMNAVGDLTFTRANNTATIAKMALNSEALSVSNGTLAFEFPKIGDVVVSGNGQC